MRQVLQRIVRIVCLAPACAVPRISRAAVTVEQYQTAAETNGYAPFSKAQYYAEQDVLNTSPATADASGDWTGTNAGGSTPTWHWVGSSHASTVTSFDANSVDVTGNGSFGFSLTTTPDFVQPTGVFQPGGASDYDFQFDIDRSATYSVSVVLNGDSLVRLGSFDGTIYFDQLGPATFQQIGVIPAGRYQITAAAGLGIDLGNGAISYSASGSFSNYNFTLQVPEPNLRFGAILIVGGAAIRRGRIRFREQIGDSG